MQLACETIAPDPYRPVVGFKLGPRSLDEPGDHGAQHRRRAEILAATRRTLAAEGLDRFTIRSVSDNCQLTAQTIHNSFGCKTELLRAALNQHTLMIDSFALSQSRDPALFLMLAAAYCQSAVERPEFVREFMHAAFSPKKPLLDFLMKFGADLKVQILSAMARRGLLRSCVDPRMAAEQIAYVNTFGMLQWAENGDVAQMYERLVHGNGAILLGILVPEAAREIEDWLNDAANRKWAPARISG